MTHDERKQWIEQATAMLYNIGAIPHDAIPEIIHILHDAMAFTDAENAATIKRFKPAPAHPAVVEALRECLEAAKVLHQCNVARGEGKTYSAEKYAAALNVFTKAHAALAASPKPVVEEVTTVVLTERSDMPMIAVLMPDGIEQGDRVRVVVWRKTKP